MSKDHIFSTNTSSAGGGTSDATAANQVIGNNSLATIATNSAAQSTAANQVIGNTLSLISTNNSTTTPLAANGVFTGTSEDVSNYAEVRVSVKADQNSAIDGLSIQFSKDGTNWD